TAAIDKKAFITSSHNREQPGQAVCSPGRDVNASHFIGSRIFLLANNTRCGTVSRRLETVPQRMSQHGNMIGNPVAHRRRNSCLSTQRPSLQRPPKIVPSHSSKILASKHLN